MDLIYDRKYVLNVIEQKVTYTRKEAPPKLKQEFRSAWTPVPIEGSLAGDPDVPTFSDSFLNREDLENSILNYGDLEKGNQTKTTGGGNSVAITDLHITAEINSKAENGESATSIIKVYNANKDTRAKLERKNAYVILQAGYYADIGLVFVGSVVKAFSYKSGTEMITEIQCVDSNVQLKTSRVSFSWPPNTYYSQIISDITTQLKRQGIAVGLVETSTPNLPTLKAPSATVASGGLSFQGLASQLLDKLASQFNFVWYITLNELYFHPRTFNKYTVQYEMKEQLLKSISPEQESQSEVASVETPSRFRVTTFLDHRIKVGQLVSIPSGSYAGKYKVISVDTRLSYLDGGAWDSELVLEAAE